MFLSRWLLPSLLLGCGVPDPEQPVSPDQSCEATGDFPFEVSQTVLAHDAGLTSFVFTPEGPVAVVSTETGVRLLELDAAGQPRTVTTLSVLPENLASSRYGQIVWTGSDFLSLAAVDHRTYLSRFGGHGEPLLVPTHLSVLDGLTVQDAAWGDEEVLVVAHDPTGLALVFRFDAAGTLLSEPSHLAPWSASSADIIWTGAEWAIAYVTGGTGEKELRLHRIPTSGPSLPQHDMGVPSSLNVGNPQVAWTGDSYAVLTSDFEPGGEVDLHILDARGSWIRTRRLSSGQGLSYFPAMVWTGDDLGVVWSDHNEGGLLFALVNAFGDIRMAPTPVGERNDDAMLPRIFSSEGAFVITKLLWDDEAGYRVQLVHGWDTCSLP